MPGGGRRHNRHAVFEVYVEKVLAPSLRCGQIVVVDNLGAHKGERVRELIAKRGAANYYCTCRRIRRTSTRLRKLSRRSRAPCGRPKPEPAKP